MRRLLLLALLVCPLGCPSGTSTGTTTPDPSDQGDRTPQPRSDRCPLLACTASPPADDGCPDPFLEFKTGSAEPNPLTMDLIEDLAAEIKATPSLRVLRLDGHAGSAETEDLARERAQTVRGFLIDNGVRAELLEITGRVDATTDDASYVTFEATDCGTPSSPTATVPDQSSVGAIDLVLQ